MRQVTIKPWRIARASGVDDFCESVFFTGNGRIGVRGFGAWARKASAQAHAIFRAGLFAELREGITDMVQLPDALTLCPVGEMPETAEQSLDLRTGVLTHEWNTPRARLRMERLASMADGQLILQRLSLTALRAGDYRVEAVADAAVRNLPVHDDQTADAKELVQLLKTVALEPGRMRLATLRGGKPVEIVWRTTSSREARRESAVTGDVAVTMLDAHLEAGETWTVEKRVRVLTAGETANPESGDPWAESAEAWAALWRQCDIQVESDDPELQGALRYNLFQLLANRPADGRAVSIGARGLTHGRYKGNTFWDTDIFMLPFFVWTLPETAKSLLLYRADRLDAARALAARQNLDGARFPWMGSDTGDEQCESWDRGLCEVHVTADVPYAMQRYAETAGDEAFLRDTAAGIYRETALYWLSRLTYEPAQDRYSSFFVKGPDEYCGAAVNNTYTNYMARFNLDLALRYSALSAEERRRMAFARDRIAILYDEKHRLFLQDELLERLEEAPFLKSGNEPSYMHCCFDRMQRYRVLKQADLVLLMSMFPDDFTAEQKRNVFEHYEPITLHDSTLSYGPHAQLAFRLGLWDKAEDYLKKAVYLDLKDVMGNTGREGLHMAAMGSVWQAVAFGALGLGAKGGVPTASPMLPSSIRRIRMNVAYHGKRYAVDASQEACTIREE